MLGFEQKIVTRFFRIKLFMQEGSPIKVRFPYGENLIAPCSQVHDNFTMGVNRKILINLIYLFTQETYLTCANGL